MTQMTLTYWFSFKQHILDAIIPPTPQESHNNKSTSSINETSYFLFVNTVL